MNLPSHQRGASVTGIVIMIVLIVVCAKLGLSIIPAQVGHYQLKKSLALQLKKSNDNKESVKEFLGNVNSPMAYQRCEPKGRGRRGSGG